MYLLNKDTASRRSIIMKNGNESITVSAEMVKFAALQIGCTEAEIYKCMEGEEESKVKTTHDILMERAVKQKK